MKRLVGAAAAASLVLGAAPAMAAGQTVLAKSGGSFDSRAADVATCSQVARRAPRGDLEVSETDYAMPTGAGLTGTAGGVIAYALIDFFKTEKGRGRAVKTCLRNMGYVELPLTDEEAASYAKLGMAQQADWERRFLAGDLSARLQPLLAPAVPRLPAYREAPMSQGGTEVEVASLKAVSTPVEKKGALITGQLMRTRTAVLQSPFETTDGPVRVSAEAGAVFHQVDYRTQKERWLRPDGATWCGQVRQLAEQGNGGKAIYCFTGRDDGYEVYQAPGFGWLAGPYRDGYILPRFSKPIVLKERGKDDLGPIDFEIDAVDVYGSVELAAVAHRDGHNVQVWTRRLKFNNEGSAVLPLWSRRAVFTRTGPHTVTVKLEDGGDGKGWTEG